MKKLSKTETEVKKMLLIKKRVIQDMITSNAIKSRNIG